jgi:two-component system chemotaxis sensor kinase CheA
MDDMDSIIGEFLTESLENLGQLDQDLVDLEANPEEKSLLEQNDYGKLCWNPKII